MHRIAVAGFQHETNTFASSRATFADFEMKDAWPPLVTGEAVISETAGANLPVAGFIEAASADPGIEIAPILWCSAEPSGPVADDAFERISGMILDGLAAAGPLDGVYLDLHGAMVTASHDDGEGELLARIRARLGETIPIAVSLDLHANITADMVRHASAIAIFRTYPHLDMAETGARAFAMMQWLLGGMPLAKAFRQAPFLIAPPAQYTGAAPAGTIYGRLPDADAPCAADIAMGFTAADIADTGPSVVAYAPAQEEADALADELLDAIVAAEPDFDGRLLSMEDAVRMAAASDAGRPVVIADVEDNPGAGAPSDTTGLLSALVRLEARGAVVALLNDPDVARRAHDAGPGGAFRAALGGKSEPGDTPFEGRFRVEGLSDGRFAFTGEMYGGSVAELGPTAVLRVLDTAADVRVVVGSYRSQCLDRAVLAHIGISPEACRIIGVKSTVHFRADFEPIAARVLNAVPVGAGICRPDTLDYSRLRPGIRRAPAARRTAQ